MLTREPSRGADATDPVIDADALPTLAPALLLDARSPETLEVDPAPGTVRVPLQAWIAAARDADTGFDNVPFWERRIAELGVDGDTLSVIFDDGRMTEAARVWFILQYFGAPAAILNGGWPRLASFKRSSGTLSQDFRPGDGPFTAAPATGPVRLMTRDQIRARLDEPDLAVFDSRTEAEFRGDDRRDNRRGGHIPGARLIEHADLLEGSHLKSAAALRALIEEAGFKPGEAIVTHCDGGGRAALAAAAALRAGFDDVRVYYLSFSDWAQDESCPVVTPHRS